MNNLILSVDKLNTFSVCPRKYFFNFVLSKEATTKPKYFLEGEFFHRCLEYYYKDKLKGRVQATPFYLEIAQNFAAEFEGLEYSDFEVLYKTLSQYLEYYANEDWKIEEVEAPFAKVLFEDEKANLRVIIRGKSDLLITSNNGHGLKSTVDHKLLARFEEKTERDNQILAYSWAFDRRDFFLNKIGKQSSYPPEKKFVRDYFCISQANIDEWIEETIYTSLEIAKFYDKKFFPAKFTACTYRGMKCLYHSVCAMGRENWEYTLESNFNNRKDFDLMNSSNEND
jgi:hypothetical protein